MEQGCAGVLEQLEAVVAAKARDAGQAELKSLLSQTALSLVKLRQAARQQVEEVEAHRVDTLRSKANVEASNLALQNLLYEQNYYAKEIASCRSFRSKYTDEQIGLVPVEAFLQEAPEQYKANAEDEHQLQQQRLEYEKSQRLELLKGLEAVKQRKAASEQIVAGKRKLLEDLQSQLSALREGAQPIRSLLGLPTGPSARGKAALAAMLLPVPLYVLYHQLQAVKEAFGEDLNLTCSGSDKEAVAWSQSSGAAVFERDDSVARKRRKLDSSKSASSTSSEPLFAAHPMGVDLEVGSSTGKPLGLHFAYLPALECVTVKAADAAQQQLLGELFPGDTGAALPNELPQQTSSTGSLEYDAARPDRPYMWAQHLAGLDFLPALSQNGAFEDPAGRQTMAAGMASYRKQRRVQNVLRRLRTAANAAMHAAANLQSLPLASDTEISKAPLAVKRVRTWDEVVLEKAQAAPSKLSGQSAAQTSTVSEPAAAAAAVQTSAQNESDEEEGQLPETHA